MVDDVDNDFNYEEETEGLIEEIDKIIEEEFSQLKKVLISLFDIIILKKNNELEDEDFQLNNE